MVHLEVAQHQTAPVEGEAFKITETERFSRDCQIKRVEGLFQAGAVLQEVGAHAIEHVQVMALGFWSMLLIKRFDLFKHGRDFGSRVDHVADEAAP